MHKILSWLLLCFSFSVYAEDGGDALLAKVAAQIDKHAVVRAEFSQSKSMAALKRPLQTQGKFVFSRTQGVLWQIEQPYRISYVLGEERVVEIAADGSRKERSARDLPGLAQVGRVFRAMLGADTAALRQYFDLRLQGDENHWQLTLKPRQAQIAQFISNIEIEGGVFVSEIRLQEVSGDTSKIQFRNSVGSNALSASELVLFSGGP